MTTAPTVEATEEPTEELQGAEGKRSADGVSTAASTEGAESPQEGVAANRPFSDPAKAREAARRSAEVRRERKAGATADVSTADMAGIVSALKTKAMKGDVAASRELREWLRQAKDEGHAHMDVLALLTQEQRALVRSWLGL